MNELFRQLGLALLIIVAAMLAGLAITRITVRLNKRMKVSRLTLLRTLRFIRIGLFLASLVLALAILQVPFAQELGQRTVELLPTVFVLIILWLLGYAFISLIVDIVSYFLLRYGEEYLKELNITRRSAHVFFFIAKMFLVLLFIAVSLKAAALSLLIIDIVIVSIVVAGLLFATATLTYAFKDYLANFLLSTYVRKFVLKPGHHVRVGDEVGEVVSVTNHGAVLVLSTGYKRVIPNARLMREDVLIKRTRSDIHKLEPLLKSHVVQLPSHCGPASAAMMLNFFGYKTTQEEVAKLSRTKVRTAKDKDNLEKEFGTEPAPLISAVTKLTKGKVKGKLILYDEIGDLKEEAKVWLTEGALLILWYKKPVLFPEKQSKSGHFVLGVGVEDDSVIVMDPSRQTAGVYMVNYDLVQEAMAQHDKKRGYIVFAKKGSPAYWRLTEGLYYADTELYEESLSRSFERYLSKSVRESSIVREFISPFVELFFEPDEEKVKPLWKPDLGSTKRKRP